MTTSRNSAAFRLQVKFWGVRGSIPTPTRENLGFGGNTTCLEVRSASQDLLVIDGGSGARGLGMSLVEEFAGRPLEIGFLMTHFHWDHIQGLPFFAPLSVSTNRITFRSGRPPHEVRKILQRQMSDPYYPIGLEGFAAAQDYVRMEHGTNKQGGMAITPFPLNHPQRAWGYRIEAGGASIVIAFDMEHGDAKLDSTLRDHAQNADILVYDAQYTPEEYASKRGWGHSTWLEATRVARDARVKRLVLFHHDPSRNDSAIKKIVTDARRHFEGTSAAKEGCRIGA